MNTALHWQVIPGSQKTQISISGAIDEFTDLDALFDEIPPRAEIAINLSQVKRISSAGVRVWICFMEKLKEHDMSVELEGCSVVLVRQMNMISQFRGHGVVRSAYAPYYCVRCNKEQHRLIELGADVASQLRKPMVCPTCGSEIDLDEEESLYTELET